MMILAGMQKEMSLSKKDRDILGWEGLSIYDNPSDYSQMAKNLLKDLGINLDLMRKNISDDFPMSNPSANNVLAIPGSDGHVISQGNWILTTQGIGDIDIHDSIFKY